tara:strand:+ start:184 stop:396 length:213 start_codon:yes stop_codon:yes gene_type:complete
VRLYYKQQHKERDVFMMNQEQLEKYNELERLVDKAMRHSKWPNSRLEDMAERYMHKMEQLENGVEPYQLD